MMHTHCSNKKKSSRNLHAKLIFHLRLFFHTHSSLVHHFTDDRKKRRKEKLFVSLHISYFKCTFGCDCVEKNWLCFTAKKAASRSFKKKSFNQRGGARRQHGTNRLDGVTSFIELEDVKKLS